MDYEEYKRKALEPIVNYIESVMASYSKEELEARIKKALPEKESEDERIKRGLLRCLNDIDDGWIALHGISKNDAIAYLEKQKEQKPAEYINITQKILDYIDKDLKKYENKRPVLGDVWTITKKCTFPNAFNGKPIVEVEKDGFGWMRLPEEIVEIKNGQKKPTEWSEEDEKMLSDCIEAVGSMSIRSDVKTLRDWLKSLRPQPHWRPSEEQMIYLKEAINKFDFCDAENAGLQALYNDLQKLL